MDAAPDLRRLAAQARDGDTDALAALVERLRWRLFALAYAELRHYQDAQDAVATALLRICRGIADLRETERVAAWFDTVTRHEARRLRRARARRAGDELRSTRDAAPEHQDTALLRLDVERELRRLPADQGHALALFYLGGVSIREIAQRVERPEGTVKSWLHHGRRRLAGEMKEYGPMPQEWTAAIVTSELAPAALQALTDALRDAGWREVRAILHFAAAGRLSETGSGETREFHLPAALRDCRLVLLDERIEGRSAFELIPLLNGTVERQRLAVGVLLAPAAEAVQDVALHAAWISGVDLALTKPVAPDELGRFAAKIRADLAALDPVA